MKKIIDTKDLKDLQMEIADYVDEFCKKNNIKYSLACGTLIGAVRHGGFIPWDDDLDIMLLREDFNKLADLWDNSNSPFLFHCINKGNNQGLPYGKISNPLTVLDENDQRTMGVNIDVYPIDEVLDINDFNIRHKSVLDWYLEMSYVSRSLKGSLNTILRNIIRKIQHYPNTPNRIAKTINRIAESENGKGGIMLFEMVAGRGYKKPFLKESFSETMDIKFEDRVYQALKGYDEYLTSMFGDYMKLPPEEKRVSHHHFKAWYK